MYTHILVRFSRASILYLFLPALIVRGSTIIPELPRTPGRAHAPFQHMTFQSLPPPGRQLETASAITRVVVIRIVLILCMYFAMPCTDIEEEGDAS